MQTNGPRFWSNETFSCFLLVLYDPECISATRVCGRSKIDFTRWGLCRLYSKFDVIIVFFLFNQFWKHFRTNKKKERRRIFSIYYSHYLQKLFHHPKIENVFMRTYCVEASLSMRISILVNFALIHARFDIYQKSPLKSYDITESTRRTQNIMSN